MATWRNCDRRAALSGFAELKEMAGRLGMSAPRWLVVLAMVGAASIWSAPVLAAGHGQPKSGGAASTIGNDISWPQCGGSYPTGQAFGIVGVNDGLANTENPCLSSELAWAAKSTGKASSQAKAQVYVNTADPGDMYNGNPVSDWPTSGGNSTYGTCTTTIVKTSSGSATVGANTQACAWQYGYNKATQDAAWVGSSGGSASAYPWWLDVETANSWQTGASGLAMNVADLQGMVAGLNAASGTTTSVGVYSTASQWSTITGLSSSTASQAGSLYHLAEWLPGARNQRQAASNCSATSFTGGPITTTQWTGSVDYDYPCPV